MPLEDKDVIRYSDDKCEVCGKLIREPRRTTCGTECAGIKRLGQQARQQFESTDITSTEQSMSGDGNAAYNLKGDDHDRQYKIENLDIPQSYTLPPIWASTSQQSSRTMSPISPCQGPIRSAGALRSYERRSSARYNPYAIPSSPAYTRVTTVDGRIVRDYSSQMPPIIPGLDPSQSLTSPSTYYGGAHQQTYQNLAPGASPLYVPPPPPQPPQPVMFPSQYTPRSQRSIRENVHQQSGFFYNTRTTTAPDIKPEDDNSDNENAYE
ncbi:hypothetical protein GGR51DRAFT_556022 [Nemania sp. FL0031]|nr:hypothetical protein GGR51DRAFT_556022 [Nemania sp. FL0031]